jgi:hypothetical protein
MESWKKSETSEDLTPAVEGRKMSFSKRALIEGIMVFGMAGFFANGSKVEAQNVDPTHKVEQKEKRDFFHINDLFRDYAKTAGIAGEPGRAMREKMNLEYGRSAVEFAHQEVLTVLMVESMNDKGSAEELATRNNVFDQKQLENEVLLDDDLAKQASLKPEGGSLVKQMELDGKKVNVLIEFAYTQIGMDEADNAKITDAKIKSIEAGLSKDPEIGTAFLGSTQKPDGNIHFELFIKADKEFSQHPGWYRIKATADKHKDPKAVVW